MSFHANKLRSLRLGEHLGMLCFDCERDRRVRVRGAVRSEGVVDQMTASAPRDPRLKGDRTVFGLCRAGSAVLFFK